MDKFILFLLIERFGPPPPFRTWRVQKSLTFSWNYLRYVLIPKTQLLSQRFSVHWFCHVCDIDTICIGMKSKCQCILPLKQFEYVVLLLLRDNPMDIFIFRWERRSSERLCYHFKILQLSGDRTEGGNAIFHSTFHGHISF